MTTLDGFINVKDRLTAPNTFYSESGWTVKTKFDDAHLTYWPIVSDDGATLVLVGVTFADPRDAVLKIYRQSGVGGALVRSFALGELWSESEIYPGGNKLLVFTDGSPQWFSGGRFAFSPDGGSLVYTHANGGTTVIRVRDGAVNR